MNLPIDDLLPAMRGEAALRDAIEQSERNIAAGHTVPLAEVLAELDGVIIEMEARRLGGKWRSIVDLLQMPDGSGCVDFEPPELDGLLRPEGFD